MPRITRKIEFDAGHRVLRHESKCAHLHGHRYVAEVTISAPSLDPQGRVVDFGVVKELIGGWVDENWDHNMLLHPDDPLVNAIRQLNKAAPIDHEASIGWEDVVFGGKEPYLFPKDTNPTAENIARVLFEQAQKILNVANMPFLNVERVRIYETPNCWADHPY